MLQKKCENKNTYVLTKLYLCHKFGKKEEKYENNPNEKNEIILDSCKYSFFVIKRNKYGEKLGNRILS